MFQHGTILRVCKVFVTIGINLVINVSAFDAPFAPLGLAIGWIKMYYIPFASLRLWQITYQHLPNAKRAFITLVSVRKVYREHVSPKTQAPAVRKV